MSGICYRLFFRDPVSTEAINHLFRRQGLSWMEPNEWRMSQGVAHTWSSADNAEPLYPQELPTFQTFFGVDLPTAPAGVDILSNRHDEHGRLAVEVACLCEELSPFLVFSSGRTYTPQDCQRLRQSGAGFEEGEPTFTCQRPGE